MDEREKISSSKTGINRRNFLRLSVGGTLYTIAKLIGLTSCEPGKSSEETLLPIDIISSTPTPPRGNPISASTPGISPPAQRKSLPSRIMGLHLPSYEAGKYQLSSTRQSLLEASTVHPNMIAISTVQYQESIHSTTISATERTATDDDLTSVIQEIHRLGYPIMLMPKLDLLDNTNQWHGQIGAGFGDKDWQDWFNSYRTMINRYATLAQQNEVELFVVGNEYAKASPRAGDWLTTIKEARARYSGPLTYAAHIYEFEFIKWWQELDFMSLNPYFELTKKNAPSIEELMAAWKPFADKIESVVTSNKGELIFTEIGYPSVTGANQHPWDFRLPEKPAVKVDLEEQTMCYKTLLASFWHKKWWRGVCWWRWDIDPNVGGLKDGGYALKGKPAADVVKFYSDSIR